MHRKNPAPHAPRTLECAAKAPQHVAAAVAAPAVAAAPVVGEATAEGIGEGAWMDPTIG